MSVVPPDPTCAEIAEAWPELALGVLTGRDRVAALAHLETCSHCSDQVEQLSRVADAVVQVAPEREPPMGFEVRLFDRMGVSEDDVSEDGPSTDGPSTNGPSTDGPTILRPRRLRPPAWALAVAAAVVALVIGLGAGWSLSSSSPRHPTTAVGHGPAGIVTAAALRENGQAVGRVSITSGSNPWMYMTLGDESVQGKVTCQVVTDDGVTHTVGTFTVKQGYGTWGAPLPVSPGDVHRAQVVSAQGTVIATATLS